MATAHNSASKGDFAKTVLMPGDPLRSEYIAKKFIKDAHLVNNVRGVQGYTGTYKGIPVSVMASGMGMPSMGIYSYELFHEYDVENIIRIGSAGALVKDLNLKDMVAAMGACTDSNYANQYRLPGTFAPTCSYLLLKTAMETAAEMKLDMKAGNILTSDLFYDAAQSNLEWSKMGVLAVDMEAAALYLNAARAGKNALALVSISDQLVRGEALNAEDRQLSFKNMIEVALEVAYKLG